ncbi:MAG: TIGR03545 family protein [Oligoflexales bacterium]
MATPKVKTPKKVGPIRTNVVLPTIIFVAAVYVYFALFFDNHLRWAFEYVGTTANGAEVNVKDVDTSFWNANFRLNGLQVTDPLEPQFNKVQIDTIEFGLVWDALLRAKFVSDVARMTGIGLKVKRAYPGKVIPPEKNDSDSFVQQRMNEIKDSLSSEVKNRLQGSFLGNLVAILQGGSIQEELESLKGSLKSKELTEKLEAEYAAKSAKWDEKVKALGSQKLVKEYEDRIQRLQKTNTKSPQEVLAAVKEAEALVREIEAKIKEVDQTAKDVNNEFTEFAAAVKDLEATIKNDIADLEQRVKIPSLDIKDISSSIFGPMLLNYIAKAKYYSDLARNYIPPNLKHRGEKKEEVTPPARARGKSYSFGRPGGYPMVWFKLVEISSRANSERDLGNMEGRATHLTSDQTVTNLPTEFKFAGDFPAIDLLGLQGSLIVDHRDKKSETFDLKAERVPFHTISLANSSDISFAIAQAEHSVAVNGTLYEDDLNLNYTSVFKKVVYEIDSKAGTAREILRGIMANIPTINLQAAIQGTFPKLAVNASSNLGTELKQGLELQIKEKITAAKQQIRTLVDQEVTGKKTKLLESYNATKQEADKILAGDKEALNEARDRVQAEIKKLQSGGQKEVDEKLEKEKKKLQNKLRKFF